MDSAQDAPKFFDYLPAYEQKLKKSLGIEDDLIETINLCRSTISTVPRTSMFFSRAIIEGILKSQLGKSYKGDNLEYMINDACDDGLLDEELRLKFQKIRLKGNRGVHGQAQDRSDARICLLLLDQIFRWYLVKLEIDTEVPQSVPSSEPMLLANISSDFVNLAQAASQLSENPTIENDAKNAVKNVEELQSKIEAEIVQIDETLFDIGKEDLSDINKTKLNACDSQLKVLVSKSAEANRHIEEIDIRVQNILDEHDFIHKLLKGDAHSTEKQFEVMAFPRSDNIATNVLQIAGGAGTGKTLCLIAKLIQDIKASDQMSFLPGKKKRALFLCFNKNLASYVRNMLAKYPEQFGEVTIENYDNFFNQLVRDVPKTDYEYLKEYAEDVRYPDGATIIYGHDLEELIATSMRLVSEKFPKKAKEYYLDYSIRENVAWVNDEIAWLEGRYEDPSHAKEYLNVSRKGRGGHRMPNAQVRTVILEIWAELRKQLGTRHYTIGQAIKRLMKSEKLPKYNAIAIDEVQDLSLQTIKLIMKFKSTKESRIYLSGDENQKIYTRDFTWKELGESVKGYTITLEENKRNSTSINKFSKRLLGETNSYEDVSECVHIKKGSKSDVVLLVRQIIQKKPSETIAIISSVPYEWEDDLKQDGFAIQSALGGIMKPGIYCLGVKANKGLEFDNVIVDYTANGVEDIEEEKRLRYVHFSRARKRLYVCYRDAAPLLLKEYYADFLR